jgi:tetratricopeptide (TPR) repeat protein
MKTMEIQTMLGLIVSGILAIATPSELLAQSETQLLIDGAMKECHQGRVLQDRAARIAHFEKGQALGEQAVRTNDQSADAHFALFCNLGELMRIDGELSISSVTGFRRMMKELDRTLVLAPDHLDALSAKGTFLVRLPGLLGGDAEKGEQLLRYVIKLAPQSVNARLSLAKSYCAHGRHGEAITLATQALDIAYAQRRDDFIPEASKVLAQLRSVGNKAN